MATDLPPRTTTLLSCHNTLIVRFCLYGYLKNLKFFEPFLVTVLLKWGLSLTTIGALISVEKMTCYAMELPSGYLSDRYGARSTLCCCFVLYICSFLCYYFGQVHVGVLVLASFFYGLGEAMRSGAHKSMVFLFLERHDLLQLKSYLNGRTRTFSLLGSATAAVAGIFFALYFTATANIFLCSIPPYLIDLCVIASYPNYMNTTTTLSPTVASGTGTGGTKTKTPTKKKKSGGKSGGFLHDMKALVNVLKQPGPRRVVLTTAATGVFHRIFKDFVQPVVLQHSTEFEQAFVGARHRTVNATTRQLGPSPSSFSFPSASSPSSSNNNNQNDANTVQVVILGISYFLFYVASSPASQNAYRLPALCGSKDKNIMDGLLDGYAVVVLVIALALYVDAPILAPFMYVLLYVLYNFSKPLSSAAVSDVAGKRLRATVFSADAGKS